MNRPDDIPQDVWDAAEKPEFRIKLDMAAMVLWDIRPTIARAIMAERERCAVVADAQAMDWQARATKAYAMGDTKRSDLYASLSDNSVEFAELIRATP